MKIPEKEDGKSKATKEFDKKHEYEDKGPPMVNQFPPLPADEMDADEDEPDPIVPVSRIQKKQGTFDCMDKKQPKLLSFGSLKGVICFSFFNNSSV